MIKKIGISVYPEQSTFEEDKKYLDFAKEQGYSILFTSLLHLFRDKTNIEKNIEKLKMTLQYAKSIGFYTILDIVKEVLDFINVSFNDVSIFEKWGVSCLRLDGPFSAKEIKIASQNESNIDVQLNTSKNDKFIDHLMCYRPNRSRLNTCHNFYPQLNTGLEWMYFRECNKEFMNHRIDIAAFVGSHEGKMTVTMDQSSKELVTVEELRFLPIDVQARILFATEEINYVIIGNAYASKEELVLVSNVDRNRIELKIDLCKEVLEVEKNILKEKIHYRRGDGSVGIIRSSYPRRLFMSDKNYIDKKITPRSCPDTLEPGDVIIANDNFNSYKGEVHIIISNNYKFDSSKFNYVGKINWSNNKRLIENIVPQSHFRIIL